MLERLYDFKLEHNKHGIFLCFSGHISQDLLVEIGDSLKLKMKREEVNSTTILKVFSMFIEQAQNILRYSADSVEPPISDQKTGGGIMMVGHKQQHYYVICGNVIENCHVNRLSNILIELQNMNREELKQYYKERRKSDIPEDSKGAGLGFIELARKATHPIEFNFRPIDENFSFFSLKTEI
ncbi:MAG: SiaB family protein kinase [Thiotrichaceae bacterium]